MKNDPIPNADTEFSALMLAFSLAIPAYATLLEIAAARIAGQLADANYFAFALACQTAAINYGQQWTAWKTAVREGGDGPATGLPQALVLPATVPVVPLGIEPRFRALMGDLKKHPAYNDAIGQALGIEGTEKPGPDFATFGPVLKLEQTGAGVMVRWNWRGQSAFLDLLEIEVDRGSGFHLLSYDSTPDYLDTTPITVAAKWIYRAIFRVGDARVGQWSGPVSINVAP
jgi:hypothetical protein